MKRKFVVIMLIICMVCLCVCFSACSEEDENVIRLNEVTHSVFYAPLYVAINQGYFAEQGLKIELTNGGGADKTMTAVLSGQADIGFCGPEASIYVFNEGKKDYPIVIGQLTKRDGSFVIARSEMRDFDWETAFIGKEIIGGRKGGVPAMALEYALKQNGYVDGVNTRINYDVQYDLISAAFDGGTGDYCTMFEPAATNFALAGKGYVVASVGEEAGDIPYTCFCAEKSYLKKNPEKVKKFLGAIQKGVDFVSTHTAAEVAQSVAPSFADTSLSVLTSAISNYMRIGAYVDDMKLKQEDFEHLQDIIISAGVMSKRADYSKLVDNSFLG
ncbi:MAG TPA: hypothetical protein DIC18_03995 [Clostridiales bacterium]|nr:hypothetical protein [Clostridiales bacterium]